MTKRGLVNVSIEFVGAPVIVNVSMFVANLHAIDETSMVSMITIYKTVYSQKDYFSYKCHVLFDLKNYQ